MGYIAFFRIPLIFGVISVIAGFIRKQRFVALSRNYFVRRFIELNDDILSHPGRMGFLAFYVTLLRIFYVIVLRDPPP
jgi:hypothetical protein